MDTPRAYAATHFTPEGSRVEDLRLVPEALLTLHVQGQPYASVARTPGHEEELVTGLCYVDGLIDSIHDFASPEFFPSGDRDRAEVRLTDARHRAVLPLLADRAALRPTPPVAPDREREPIQLSCAEAWRLADCLSDHQRLRAETLAAHAVGLFDARLEPLVVMEDLGRHNAFDKAIGDLVRRARTREARIAMLSSRVASELMHKALRLDVSLVLSYSRPTEGALRLARQGGVGLACLAKDGGYYRFN